MKSLSIGLILYLVVLVFPLPSYPYPNGPIDYVTDAGPFCAGCHASRQKDQLSNVPQERNEKEYFENKHYALILNPNANPAEPAPYATMSEADRKKLLEDVKLIDDNASIALVAPSSAKVGEKIRVSVKAKGGSGPVVGIMLVDQHHRWQARPVASDGWQIVDPPKVIGPDGKEQTRWLDLRNPGSKKNLNYVLVFGITPDLQAKKFSTSEVIYTLKAPMEKGAYTLCAVYLYGTEKSSPVGFVQQVGYKLPKGGRAARSGRILFSKPTIVNVQ